MARASAATASADAAALAAEPAFHLRGGHRASHEVALDGIDAAARHQAPLAFGLHAFRDRRQAKLLGEADAGGQHCARGRVLRRSGNELAVDRSEEHTSELQSLMRISYAVFCLKKT